MSVNSIHACNPEIMDKFGRYFKTIDFEFNNSLNLDLINSLPNYKIGLFFLGNYKKEMSVRDLNSLHESCVEWLSTYPNQKFKNILGYDLNRNEVKRVSETCSSSLSILIKKVKMFRN